MLFGFISEKKKQSIDSNIRHCIHGESLFCVNQSRSVTSSIQGVVYWITKCAQRGRT